MIERPLSAARFDIPDPVQHFDGRRQQFAAGRVRHDAPAVAVEQPPLQLVFQLRQGLAGGGLRKSDAPRRAGDGAFLVDGREDLQLPESDLHGPYCKSVQPNRDIDIIRFTYFDNAG